MQQGTDNWLNWRTKGIGSSDAPAIMGVSPWKTIRQLYNDKVGLTPKSEPVSNWAIDRGNRLEPIARAKYELMRDIEMGPATCQHFELDYMRASMDGWNPPAKRGLEIKCPGVADHEKARAGFMPEKYVPQVMHQFFVTGAVTIDYASYYVPKGSLDHQGELLIVEVKPDLAYIREYVARAKEFWDCVQKQTPPDLTSADFKICRLIVARKAAEEWKIARRALDEIESRLYEHAGKTNKVIFQGTGVRINDNKIEVFAKSEAEQNGN